MAKGSVVRQARGVYVTTRHAPTASNTLAQVAKRVPEGVVCLLTALRFHGLTTQSPAEVWIAARETGDDYQPVLTSYCLERFPYRLGASDRRDRFVLEGAMLLRLWSERPYRATLDLDLLRRGDGTFDAIL